MRQKRKTILFGILFFIITGGICAQEQELKIREIKAIDTFQDYVREVKFSPFGAYIAVTSGDNIITLYSNQFQKLWSSQGERGSVGGKCIFSPDEKYLAFTRFRTKGDVGILDIENIRITQSLEGLSHWVNCIAYSPDGNFIATGGSEKQVIVWQWDGEEFVKIQVLEEHQKPISDILFSSDQKYLISASEDKSIIIWKFNRGKPTSHQVLTNTYYVNSIALSPDNRFLVSGTSDRITIWKKDSENFAEEIGFKNNAGRVWSLDFSPDSKYFAAALSNATVKIWHRDDGKWKYLQTLYRHNDNVFDATFSADGKFLATGSSDQTAIFYNLEGVESNSITLLLNYIGRPFTTAQKLLLNPITTKRLLSELDNELTAPKDEFETTDEYKKRQERLQAHALFRLQKLTEEYFGVQETSEKGKTSGIIIREVHLKSYNADTETYRIKFLGTEGYLKIPPTDARMLKKNHQKASIRGRKVLNEDSVSYNYQDFVLVHPVNEKFYEISMEENPFRGTKKKGFLVIEEKGEVPGPNIEIENLQFDSIFPVFYKHYDENPIGKAFLINNGTVTVEEIAVSLFIKQYMDNPKLCQAPKKLKPGERKEIELYSLFTNRVLEISEGNKVSVKISVEYSYEGNRYKKETLDTIHLFNRNAVIWDDDNKVAAFVTAKDPAVLKFSKNVAGAIKGKASKALNPNLLMGIGIFGTLQLYDISYVVDPTTPYREFSQKPSVDFLQFPNQTLEFKAGDCDDLSILYNALLESVGIKTAFITIPGHIFPAFSLDVRDNDAKIQFLRTDDFIFMNGETWLPVEITLIDEGFLKAWQSGARQWRNYSRNGEAVLYPTQQAWQVYKPVGFHSSADIRMPVREKVVKVYLSELRKFIDREINEKVQQLKTEIQKSKGSSKPRNTLGVLYARYGLEEEALGEFHTILAKEEHVPALINTGNIYLMRDDVENALHYYERALNKDTSNPRVLLYLTKVHQEMGDYDKARKIYNKLKMTDAGLANEFSYLDVKSESNSRAAQLGVVSGLIVWEEN
jgi:tetratricopeptide (TPR) repeat protein